MRILLICSSSSDIHTSGITFCSKSRVTVDMAWSFVEIILLTLKKCTNKIKQVF